MSDAQTALAEDDLGSDHYCERGGTANPTRTDVMLERLFEFGAFAIAVLVALTLGFFLFTGGLHYREICIQQTGPDTAGVTTGDWKFHLLAWFAPASMRRIWLSYPSWFGKRRSMRTTR